MSNKRKRHRPPGVHRVILDAARAVEAAHQLDGSNLPPDDAKSAARERQRARRRAMAARKAAWERVP
jgi:hypothetical protein